MIYSFEMLILLIFALGWGSFATMAVYRLSHGEPWIGQKPYCTSCGHELKFIDYISLISFFLYRGKCRYCKQQYEYHKIYFITELLILIFFILNYLKFNFSEIFILNAGIIISGVIWSIIYFTHQINSNKMMMALLFFASLRGVLLSHSIYNILYGAILAILCAITLRHLYFLLKGNHKLAMDYLEFKPEDRFANHNFTIIKLAAIWGVILGVSMHIIYMALITIIILAIFRNLKYSLPVITNVMIFLLFYI